LVDEAHEGKKKAKHDIAPRPNEEWPEAQWQARMDALIREIGRPWGGFVLALDTETLLGLRQHLRVGAYQVHGISREKRRQLASQGRLTREALDTFHEAGFFYDPLQLDAKELVTLRAYCRRHGLRLWRQDAFIKKVLYFWVHGKPGAIFLAHNAPFDLSRL